MKIWLDNTGLHAGGRCLIGQAKTEVDVEGLVQLGCFIGIGRSLHVNGFEESPIRNFTEETQQRIAGLGPDGPPIVIEPSSTYRAACLQAGKVAAMELRHGFDLESTSVEDLKPSNVRAADVASQVAFARSVMDETFDGSFPEIADLALGRKAVGAFDLMLASSDLLREALVSLRAQQFTWTDDEIYAVTAACRYHLNQVLADQVGGVAGPAVARARMVSRRNAFTLEALDESLRTAASNAIDRPIPTPPLFGVLVRRSRGDPGGLVEEAKALNERLAEAVEAFEADLNLSEKGTIGSAVRHKALTKEISDSVARSLNLQPKKQFPFGALLVSLLGWIPTEILKTDGPGLREWWAERSTDRKWAVFSEVVDGTPEDVRATKEWDQLVRRSRGLP